MGAQPLAADSGERISRQRVALETTEKEYGAGGGADLRNSAETGDQGDLVGGGEISWPTGPFSLIKRVR